MDTSAIKAMMAEIAPVIREYVAGEIAPYAERSAALAAENEKLAARLAEVEARAMPDVSGFCDATAVKGLINEAAPDIDGSLAPLVESNAVLTAENKALADANAALAVRIADLESRSAGIDEALVAEMLETRLASLPTPEPGKDGKDCDMTEVKALIDGQVAETVSAAFAALPMAKDGEPGKDGADCDMKAVHGMIDELTKAAVAERLAEAVAALPAPEKGEPGADCDMQAVAAMIAERVETAVKAIPAAKDGIGLANALKNSEGHLILTMTDGSTHDIGMIDGKDGQDGKTFTLDDFDIIPLDDPRDYKFCFTQGDTMHSFELEMPGFVDKGVWRDTDAYRKGDGVTWAGSFWIAQRDNPAKPDTADGGWRLAAKKGRDGKDASK